jgi:hypothetical protein
LRVSRDNWIICAIECWDVARSARVHPTVGAGEIAREKRPFRFAAREVGDKIFMMNFAIALERALVKKRS